MAKQIKITPTLRGKDAITFLKRLDENKDKKVSPDVILDIRNTAQKLKDILVK